MDRKYKQVGKMCFKENTPENVCNILSTYARNHTERLRVFYGDTETGRCWMDEYDTIGYIGCSTGECKVPLLIYSSKSNGGSAILDDCILKIMCGKRVLYQHPLFNMPEITANGLQVFFDSELYANCTSEKQAERLALFMAGKRNCK